MRLRPTSQRLRRILIVLLLLVAGVGIWWLFEGREPHYQGRSVSAWIAELGITSSGQANESLDALLAIGPESLPPLVAELKRRDTVVSRTYSATRRKLPAVIREYLPRPIQAAERRGTAAWALGQIGAAASATASALLVALEDPDERVRFHAAEALRYLRVRTPEIVAGLTRHLKDSSLMVRSRSAEALADLVPDSVEALPGMIGLLHDPGIAYHGGICLRELGPLATNAIPDLIDTIRQGVAGHPPDLRFPRASAGEDPSAHHRAMACLALGKIGVASKEVLGALEFGLRYTNSWVHENAAIALAEFGTNAAPVIPALIQSLSETNLRARAQIVHALGTMGLAARIALPVLEDLQTNTEQTLVRKLNVADNEKWGIYWLRAAAIRAIAQIDPTNATVLVSYLDVVSGDSLGRQILSRHPSASTIVPELERRLATNDGMSARHIAEFLARIDPKQPAALGVMERGMVSTNASQRAYAAFWHWKLTGDAPATLKVLTEALNEPASPTSQSFPHWLREMGPAARPAVPALLKALWHHDLYTRRNAAKALETIDPAALRTAPREGQR